MSLRRWVLALVISMMFFCFWSSARAEQAGQDNWWLTPHRLLQTNLREIDATMDTDQYVREAKEFGANIVLFNVGGIVANYPTELEYHWRNTFMNGDLVGETLKKLHKAGIKMIGRFDFSKINEKYAAIHPEWLYVSEKGEHVNYNGQVHTCVMGGYQQYYLLDILKEALTRYPLDGVFFNMIGFPQTDYSRVFHGICQCQNCKKSFKEFCGLDIPKHDSNPQTLRKHQQWKSIQVDRQFGRVRDLIKSIRSDIVICTYTVEHIDLIRKESGAPLGQETWDDVERAQWTLLTTENKQLANTTVHFYQMIFRHSAAAPYLHTRRLWQQMVNGAWLDFYCIGPLQRLEDRAGIGPISDIYRFHAHNEKWLLHTESAAEVGLVRRDGDDYWGWFQILSENHIPFDLVSFRHSDLKRYRALIVPESGGVKAEDARLLDAYVKGGGKLLLSGQIPNALTCLGRPILKKTWPLRHSMYVRIGPKDKEVLRMDGLKDFDLVHLRGDFHEYEPASDTNQMLRLIHDVMYGPPEKCYYRSVSDIPALLVRDYGDGIAASFPFHIGAMYREWGNLGHSMLTVGTLDNLLKTGRRLKIESSPLVEATHRRDPKGRFEWIALYNHSGRLENSFHPPIPIKDIEISLRTSKDVKIVRLLKDKQQLGFSAAKNGLVKVTVPELKTYEIVLFEYQ
ncbi:MAG: beta-galactosidase trimerization domain-containing protein [Sedimentisphaerales bacterium]|nr:beta-galactosidase trimerization domain-containing protein [Sedimentisphaerales bacterium]